MNINSEKQFLQMIGSYSKAVNFSCKKCNQITLKSQIWLYFKSLKNWKVGAWKRLLKVKSRVKPI